MKATQVMVGLTGEFPAAALPRWSQLIPSPLEYIFLSLDNGAILVMPDDIHYERRGHRDLNFCLGKFVFGPCSKGITHHQSTNHHETEKPATSA